MMLFNTKSDAQSVAVAVAAEKSVKPGRLIWQRMKKSKLSMISMFFILFLIVASIAAPLFVNEELVTLQDVTMRNQPPSAEHWFGTDIYGRDLFARVLYGARVSLAIGIVTTIISTILGALLGALSAYYGGILDDIIMRSSDMFMAIPEQLLAMVVVASLGASATSLIIAMSLAVIPGRARLVRSTVQSIIDTEYVEAAKACGMSDFKIIMTEIMPNALGPIIVVSTQGLASIILTASSLSYLGVGIQPPTPEWGAIIADAREYLRMAPYMCVIPGIVMVLTALAFNLMGDGLRDAMDPRLKD